MYVSSFMLLDILSSFTKSNVIPIDNIKSHIIMLIRQTVITLNTYHKTFIFKHIPQDSYLRLLTVIVF